jgi:hypothetical protein
MGELHLIAPSRLFGQDVLHSIRDSALRLVESGVLKGQRDDERDSARKLLVRVPELWRLVVTERKSSDQVGPDN